jgi:hypothetical protein
MTKALVTLGLALAAAVGVAGPARADGTFTVERTPGIATEGTIDVSMFATTRAPDKP